MTDAGGEITRLLAPHAAAWRTLLTVHIAEEGGHCRGCRSPAVGAPVWPCRLWVIADDARRVAGAGRPDRNGPDSVGAHR